MVTFTAGIDRRALLAGAASFAAVPAAMAQAPTVTITDMVGRRVPLAEQPSRIVLLEARDILTMGAIHPAPAKLVVGWAAADRIDSKALQEAYEQQAGHPISVVGTQAPGSVSLEALIALAPDLVVASAYANGGDDRFVERMESAGIPVVFGSAVTNQGEEGRSDDLGSVPITGFTTPGRSDSTSCEGDWHASP